MHKKKKIVLAEFSNGTRYQIASLTNLASVEIGGAEYVTGDVIAQKELELLVDFDWLEVKTIISK